MITVPQGGSEYHEVVFYAYDGGPAADDIRYASTGQLPVPSIVTPTGGSNPPTLATIERLGTGTYRIKVTALPNTTLTANLGGNNWKIRYQIRLNSNSPANDYTFEYPFIVGSGAAAGEGTLYYNSLADYRKSIAERYEDLRHEGIAANATVSIGINAVGILEVKKNGATLVSGVDYIFYRPGNLKFLTSVASTDTVVVRAATFVEDEEIALIAKEVKNEIDGELVKLYALPFVTVPQKVKTIEREWVRARIVIDFGPRPGLGVNERDREMALGWISSAKAALKRIIEGETQLILPDLSILAPKTDPDDADLMIDIQSDATETPGQ